MFILGGNYHEIVITLKIAVLVDLATPMVTVVTASATDKKMLKVTVVLFCRLWLLHNKKKPSWVSIIESF